MMPRALLSSHSITGSNLWSAITSSKAVCKGVGFRWLVHQEAAARGLKGWVRNTESGEVEIMVAGSEEKLAELRSVLQRGSRGSRVDAVQERDMDEALAEGLEAFRIEGAW